MFGKFWPSFEIDRANARRSLALISPLSFRGAYRHVWESSSEISEKRVFPLNEPIILAIVFFLRNARSIDVRDGSILLKQSQESRGHN